MALGGGVAFNHPLDSFMTCSKMLLSQHNSLSRLITQDVDECHLVFLLALCNESAFCISAISSETETG
jgi:hypothetical protein